MDDINFSRQKMDDIIFPHQKMDDIKIARGKDI
jgi:hypothetical protein